MLTLGSLQLYRVDNGREARVGFFYSLCDAEGDFSVYYSEGPSTLAINYERR